MAKYKVYVTDGRHESYEIEREILAAADAELKVCMCVTEDDIIRECADADGILLDMAPMTEKAVNSLKNCKIINRYGVGYDNVAVDACTARNIQVTNVPDYCAEDVSDHALALMMTCLRQTALRDRKVREGEWNIRGTSFRLSGKVLGVLGFGRIGKLLAHRLLGLGAQVTVAARKAEDRVWARSLGCETLHPGKLDGQLGEFQAVFNTVPTLLLDGALLAQLREDCLCNDLASQDGLDYDAADQLHIRAMRARGLPGKVAPVTAAMAIRDTIYHILEERSELT